MRRKLLSALFTVLLAASLALCGCVGLPFVTDPPAAGSGALPALTTAAMFAPERTPAQATASGQAPVASATGFPAPSSAAPAAFTRPEALDYFREIAFTGEFGAKTDEIRKWERAIRVSVQGKPTKEDRAALGRAMDGLNKVPGFPGISLSDKHANMTVWFVPLSQMDSLFTHYEPNNWGYFYTNWDSTGITQATVAIATDVTDQQARNHLVFEEVLQSTGLMQDSNHYPDSIYYGEWTTVQHPTKLDWELLGMLYMPGIKHCMPEKSAMEYLEKNYKPGE